MTNKRELHSYARASVGSSGYRETIGFYVENIRGPDNARLRKAITHPSVPVYGSEHPAIKGLRVIEKDAEPADKEGAFYVRVTYGYQSSGSVNREQVGQTPPTISYSSTVAEKVVFEDINGDKIIVTHTFEQSVSDPIDPTGKRKIKKKVTQEKVARIRIPVPQLLIAVTRIVSTPPARRQESFMGKVNRSRIWGYEARTLLVVKLDSVSRDGGVSYEETIEFQHNEDTWESEAVWVDEKGAVPKDLKDGVGRIFVRAIPEADFSRIGVAIR